MKLSSHQVSQWSSTAPQYIKPKLLHSSSVASTARLKQTLGSKLQKQSLHFHSNRNTFRQSLFDQSPTLYTPQKSNNISQIDHDFHYFSDPLIDLRSFPSKIRNNLTKFLALIQDKKEKNYPLNEELQQYQQQFNESILKYFSQIKEQRLEKHSIDAIIELIDGEISILQNNSELIDSKLLQHILIIYQVFLGMVQYMQQKPFYEIQRRTYVKELEQQIENKENLLHQQENLIKNLQSQYKQEIQEINKKYISLREDHIYLNQLYLRIQQEQEKDQQLSEAINPLQQIGNNVKNLDNVFLGLKKAQNLDSLRNLNRMAKLIIKRDAKELLETQINYEQLGICIGQSEFQKNLKIYNLNVKQEDKQISIEVHEILVNFLQQVSIIGRSMQSQYITFLQNNHCENKFIIFYKTIQFLEDCSNDFKQFFRYFFDLEKSKVLFEEQKLQILNIFKLIKKDFPNPLSPSSLVKTDLAQLKAIFIHNIGQDGAIVIDRIRMDNGKFIAFSILVELVKYLAYKQELEYQNMVSTFYQLSMNEKKIENKLSDQIFDKVKDKFKQIQMLDSSLLSDFFILRYCEYFKKEIGNNLQNLAIDQNIEFFFDEQLFLEFVQLTFQVIKYLIINNHKNLLVAVNDQKPEKKNEDELEIQQLQYLAKSKPSIMGSIPTIQQQSIKSLRKIPERQ